jgi:hypothetical protein
MGFRNSAHAPCLYYGTYNNEEVLILRQVDDFSISSLHASTAHAIYADIHAYCSLVQEKDPVQRIYGIDILQSRHYIKISLESYLNTMISEQPWLQDISTTDKPTAPLSEDILRAMDQASPPNGLLMKNKLQQEQGFHYRSILGKLVFAMNCGRFDISFALSKLSQFNDNPAAVHYRALRELAIYMVKTKNRGLIYWRTQSRMDLDEHAINILPIIPTERPFPTAGSYGAPNSLSFTGIHIKSDTPTMPVSPSKNPHRHSTDFDISRLMIGFSDSDHANCTQTRRSQTGSAITLAGALIDYNSKIQQSVTLSSCEAELVALVDTAKRLRYLRNILVGLGIHMEGPTTVYCDNEGAKKVADAPGTTKRLRHVDMQFFAIQEWVKNDEITVRKVHTTVNVADLMTKALSPKLHYLHMNRLMGYFGRPQVAAFTAASSQLRAITKRRHIEFESRPSAVLSPSVPACAQLPLEQEGMLTDRRGTLRSPNLVA